MWIWDMGGYHITHHVIGLSVSHWRAKKSEDIVRMTRSLHIPNEVSNARMDRYRSWYCYGSKAPGDTVYGIAHGVSLSRTVYLSH